MASAEESSNVSAGQPKQTRKGRGDASTASPQTGGDGDTMEQPRSDSQDVQNPPTAMSQLPRRSSPLPGVSTPGSTTTTSGPPSREPSPVRPPLRSGTSTPVSRAPSRRRKSSQGHSPNRTSNGASTGALPPANSVQQAFAQAKPQLPIPAVDVSSDVPSPEKSDMPSRNSPQHESARPNISSKRSPPPEGSESLTKADMGEDHNRTVARGANRGASGGGSVLETVQEASLPSTPSTDQKSNLSTTDEQLPGSGKQVVESGSESGGNRSSDAKQKKRPRESAISKTGDIMPKRSFTSLNGARGKPGDGSVRNMIVETETVSSIPQVSLGVGAGERGSSGRAEQGTIRMKPSTETIRPKKEKKRQSRKPTALPSGTVSSKADIFEAKVASAVDEADVSDSDETFVYESNPPDPYPVVQHRYHSRTPSTTSMASQMDQFASRSRGGLRDGAHSVTGKRSMKFTNNNPYNSSIDGDAVEDIGRGPSRADGNGHAARHHHIGRYGRNGYPSLFDRESPFPPSQQAPKSPRHLTGNAFRHSRHASPRTAQNYRTMGSPRKAGEAYGYDFDGEGADDERTPLVGSVRVNRSRHGRRPNSASLRQMEYVEQRRRRYFSRYGSCIFFTLLILLLIGGATTFIIAVMKPLRDLSVIEIQNVLASEQEIMLDLDVLAVNPNLFPIAVNDMDVNIFAKSRYVGSDKFWRDHGPHPDDFPRVETSKRRAQLGRAVNDTRRVADPAEAGALSINDGVDKGTDPIPDPSGDPQTMLLGRVFVFNSPLTFDPSPWDQTPSESIGQIRLRRPGNKTEEGGTPRWERVLQHPFELIVRGVVKYQLPLSSTMHLTSISSSVKVIPDGDTSEGDDGDGDIPSNDTVRINGVRKFRTYSVQLPVTESHSSGTATSQARTTRVFTA